MHTHPTLRDSLRQHGITRRSFLQFCTTLATAMSLPPAMIPTIAQALETAKRQSVIWMSFQECTACTESLTRSHSTSLESLILDHISLDYHHTLQAASGHAAEHAREEAMQEHWGEYLLLVDGSIPAENDGYSTIAGFSNVAMLQAVAAGAKAIVSIGTCAAYGGIPHANPNPTNAVSVADLINDKPIINVPGCPPIPAVITGVIMHFVTFGTLPELDSLGRPLSFYGQSIHDRCYRRPFYEKGLFADTFDDEGAKKGWCLYKVGCKGPVTYNACATMKWNAGTSFPIESGHGCLGCSEPNFWDAGDFYKALSVPMGVNASTVAMTAGAGAAAGVAAGALHRHKKSQAKQHHGTVTIDDLERKESSS